MTVHRSGALTVVAGDLQTTHRDAKIAIKTLDWGMGGSPIIALLEQKLGVWSVITIIEELDDRSDGIGGYRFQMEAERVGGIANWIRQILLPKVNAALLKRFPPLDDGGVVNPPAPPPSVDPIDDLDARLIGLLTWAPQADGTLRVSA